MTITDTSDPAVIVPVGNAPSAVVTLRSLSPRDVSTIVVSDHENPPVFWSRYCDEAVPIPPAGDDLSAYRDTLLALAQRDNVRAIIPTREVDIYTLAKYRSAFAEHVAPVWPTFDQLRAVQDRERLFAIAGDLDIPMPETTLLSETDDWNRERIVKARYSILTQEYVDSMQSSVGISPPKTIFLEPGNAPDVEAIRTEMGHDPIVQEFVRGTEYTFRGVFDRGDPVATSLKQLVRGRRYSRGPSVCHRAVRVPKLEAHGLELLDRLDWHGVASVGFLQDETTGEFKLLEVNPRFWASLPVDLHAGVDHPYHYWTLATGSADVSASQYDVGATTHYLRGELAHLYSIVRKDYPLVERPSLLGTVRDIASSLYRHPHFDHLTLDDPGPFVRDVLNMIQDNLFDEGGVGSDIDVEYRPERDESRTSASARPLEPKQQSEPTD